MASVAKEGLQRPLTAAITRRRQQRLHLAGAPGELISACREASNGMGNPCPDFKLQGNITTLQSDGELCSCVLPAPRRTACHVPCSLYYLLVVHLRYTCRRDTIT